MELFMHVTRVASLAFVFCLLASFDSVAMAQDAAAGEQVFRKNCSLCHTVQAGVNHQGPSLFGVVGRPSASLPGFHYSTADQGAKLTWDKETLDRYLPNPHKAIPGTAMAFAGLSNVADRKNIIAYLDTFH